MLRSCKAPKESFDFTLPPSFYRKLQNQRCNFPQFGRHLVLIFVQIRVYSSLCFISPRTSPFSEKKNRSKNQSNAEQIRGSHSSLSYFQFFLPKKNSNELKRDRQASRNKYEVFALVLVFSKTVYLLFSLFLSPLVHRHSPERKTPQKPKHCQKTDTRIPLLLSVVFQFSLLKDKNSN